MIQVAKPKIGERIYDGACCSCGFLCESFEYLTRERDKLSTMDLKQSILQKVFSGELTSPPSQAIKEAGE
jgi:type I restriction enzyme M protein